MCSMYWEVGVFDNPPIANTVENREWIRAKAIKRGVM